MDKESSIKIQKRSHVSVKLKILKCLRERREGILHSKGAVIRMSEELVTESIRDEIIWLFYASLE